MCLFLYKTTLKNYIEDHKYRHHFQALMLSLTEGAIRRLVQIQSGMNESFVVEITKMRKKKEEYRFFEISDGKAACNAVRQISQTKTDIQALFKKNNNQPLRIKIVQHLTIKNSEPYCIEIVQFQVVKKPKIVLETPKINLSLPKLENISKPKALPHFVKKQSIQNNISSKKKLSIKQQKYDQETKQSQCSEINIKNFQSISDLYESFYGWELLTRVIDINYNQFMSKAGKLTKILAVELIDRLNVTITGKFFGDGATARQSMIQQGKVYRVSRGRVVQDKFLNKIHQKQSKYTIIFNNDTQFLQIKDIPQIPYVSANWLRLSEVTSLPVSDGAYSFIGILTEIGDEVSIQKQGRNIIFQHFKIGDPITDLIYQCTVWSRQLKIDHKLLGKSIIIKNFKICQYKGQTTLATTFRSDLAYHPIFSKFDDNLEHFQVLEKDVCVKTLRQISHEISEGKAEPVNTVEVSVNEICFNQKWYYESCPKCKKTCQSHSKCTGCSLEIGQSSKRFKIPIQLSDYTGGIKITAFDETARLFIKNAQINELIKMDMKDLIELGNQLCFSQYRMQIAHKKDESGKINYSIVGKPTPINLASTAARNLQRIQDIISSKQLFN